MQLDLTKKQLKTLLELVYLGNWMINAHHDGSKEDPPEQDHEDMTKFIYSKAGEAGLDKEVKYDHELKEWFPTRYFEEENIDFYIDDYNNNNFFEELPERLAWRDIRKIYNEKELNKMSFEERMTKHLPLVEKYEQEFEENWLNRLVIDDGKNSNKIGRNDPCICGSGKKYKKCCGK